jgi:pimeloyl-ACP methyl ester carboxylesterase
MRRFLAIGPVLLVVGLLGREARADGPWWAFWRRAEPPKTDAPRAPEKHAGGIPEKPEKIGRYAPDKIGPRPEDRGAKREGWWRLPDASFRFETAGRPPLVTPVRDLELENGRPVVNLVHVMGESLAWPLARELEARGAVVRVVRGDFEWGDMAESLRRLRPALGRIKGSVFLVGHSFGGRMAMTLAAEYPDKVAGMALMAPQVKTLHGFAKKALGRPVADFADFQRAGGVRLMGDFHNFAEFDEWKQERNIRAPTLIFHGDLDQLVSHRYTRQIAEDPTNDGAVQAIVYQGVGHGWYPANHMVTTTADLISQQLAASGHPLAAGSK